MAQIRHFLRYCYGKLVMVLTAVVLTVPSLFDKTSRYWISVAWKSRDTWEQEQWHAMLQVSNVCFPLLSRHCYNWQQRAWEDEIDQLK